MLLPSGPDMVHGYSLRKTQTSTSRANTRPYMYSTSEKEFSLARADCELQDTATFPPSTAFTSILFLQTKINDNIQVNFIHLPILETHKKKHLA